MCVLCSEKWSSRLACWAGTIAFDDGPAFDVFLSPDAGELWMIQTNPNTVFQGTATRLSHNGSDERERR